MSSLFQFGNFIASRFAPKQTHRISQINSGLLEIDSDLIVRKSTSRVVELLLGESPLTGKRFTSIIRDRASADDFNRSVSVLEQLITDHNAMPVISDNPFDCLKITVPDANGRKLTRYIRCEFSKSDAFEHNGRWAVSIRDISKPVRVSRLIKRSNQQAEQKIDTVMSLLQFEKDLIQDYLQSAVLSLNSIRRELSANATSGAELRKKIEKIFATVHQMKGDAATLNLNLITDQIHTFENLLSELSAKPALSRADLHSLIVPLKSIVQAVKDVKDMFNKITTGGWNQSPDNAGDGMLRRLQHLVKRLEQDNNKRVIIVNDGYFDRAVPLRLRRVISSLVTQLARNAVVHGIEEAKTRLKCKKTAYGCLHISVQRSKDALLVVMRDDGRGINPENIRQVALRSGIFRKTQVLRWNKLQLLKAMFKPGLSTARQVTQHAGRGVGLDVIKSTVEKYGGSIAVKSSLGQFTEFTMTFPGRWQSESRYIPILKTPVRG